MGAVGRPPDAGSTPWTARRRRWPPLLTRVRVRLRRQVHAQGQAAPGLGRECHVSLLHGSTAVLRCGAAGAAALERGLLLLSGADGAAQQHKPPRSDANWPRHLGWQLGVGAVRPVKQARAALPAPSQNQQARSGKWTAVGRGRPILLGDAQLPAPAQLPPPNFNRTLPLPPQSPRSPSPRAQPPAHCCPAPALPATRQPHHRQPTDARSSSPPHVIKPWRRVACSRRACSWPFTAAACQLAPKGRVGAGWGALYRARCMSTSANLKWGGTCSDRRPTRVQTPRVSAAWAPLATLMLVMVPGAGHPCQPHEAATSGSQECCQLQCCQPSCRLLVQGMGP